MHKADNAHQCDISGLEGAGKEDGVDIWTEWKWSADFGSNSKVTMKDVCNILSSVNSDYSLLFNNCQDLCMSAYNKLSCWNKNRQ